MVPVRAAGQAGSRFSTYTRVPGVPRIVQPRAEEVSTDVYRSGQVCASLYFSVRGADVV